MTLDIDVTLHGSVLRLLNNLMLINARNFYVACIQFNKKIKVKNSACISVLKSKTSFYNQSNKSSNNWRKWP